MASGRRSSSTRLTGVAKDHRARMFLAQTRYQAKTWWRRSSVASWVVLLVALYISLAILVAPLQAPLRAIGVNFPSLTRYEVFGTVRNDVDGPMPAVKVSAGGFSTTTDEAGGYTLRFAADNPEDVAIVFTAGPQNLVRFVDLSSSTARHLDAKIR